MRLTDEREQFIRETGGGFADIAVLLGEVDALRAELSGAIASRSRLGEALARAEAAETERDAITQESVANMAASIEFEAQLNVAVARAEAAETEAAKWMNACAEQEAERRAAEAERDALLEEAGAWRDQARAAEARIAAALALCDTWDRRDAAVVGESIRMNWIRRLRAALVEPVGEPPRQSYNENPTVTRLTAPGGVGDPQPPTCATCGGERFVCDLGIAAGSNECAHPDCTENRRPCPSCAPTESDPT